MAMFPLPVSVELLLNGTWTDISQYVYQRDPVQITGGRSNWADTVQPASCTMTLNNADGRFTNGYPGGAYYPYLTRNTRIRVGVTATSSSGNFYSGYRFIGDVPDWPPQSDISGNDIYVQITASGPLRRINNGADQGSALERYYASLTGPFAPIAYWPCEEDSNTVPAGSGDIGSASGGPYMVITGTPTWKAVAFDGSNPMGVFNKSVWTGVTGTFNSSGDDIYLVPGTYMWTAGTTTVNAKVWAASGGGGGGGGNGGGGGEFAQETTLAVTPGNSYPVVVGAGGSGAAASKTNAFSGKAGASSVFTGDAVTVRAHGGPGGQGSGGTGSATPGGTGSTNTVHFNGGTGGVGASGHATDGGGGGGSSAGTASAGNGGGNGTSGVAGGGGAAVTGGGAGGNGGSFANGSPGGSPGGGGGGGGFKFETRQNYGGGNGANGKVELVYTPQSVPAWNVVRCVVLVPPHGGQNSSVLLRATSSSTTLARLDLIYGTGGVLALHGFNSSSSLVVNSGNVSWNIDGQVVMVSVELQQSGANVNWAMRAVLPGSSTLIGSATGTLTSATVGNITQIIANPNGNLTKTAMGHISLQYSLVPLINVSSHLNAHIGEMGIDRFIRLANEQAIDNVPEFNETNDHWSFEDNTVQGFTGVNGAVSVSTAVVFAPSTPWGPFTPNATPANPAQFQTTTANAAGISAGDRFRSALNLGQILVVTALDPPSGGNVLVHFQPMAESALVGTTDSVMQDQAFGFDPNIAPQWPTEGARSLLLTATGGAGQWYATSPTGASGQLVNVGDRVSAAADIYTPTGRNVFLNINWYSGASFLSSSAATFANPAGGITRLSVHGVAPATTDHFSVAAGSSDTVGSGVLLYCDNVVVHPMMGAQTAKAYAEFLKEIQILDQGLLKESRVLHGLGYVTRIGLFARPAQVTLNYLAGTVSPPLQPVYDDLLTANTVTVKRYKGTSVTTSLTTGTLSVQEPPAGVGKKKKTLQVVAHADEQIAAMASQLLGLGTVSDERYPQITVDLTRASIPGNALAPLMSAVALAEPGDNITITNLPFWYPNTTARQLIIGYTETIFVQPREPGGGWLITWNCVPYSPYQTISSAIRRW